MASAVILWRGRQVRLLRGESDAAVRELAEGESPASAIVELLSEWTPAPASIRLVYHPGAREKGLPALIAELLGREIEVEGAWPLASMAQLRDESADSAGGEGADEGEPRTEETFGLLERVRELKAGQDPDFLARRAGWRNWRSRTEFGRLGKGLRLAGCAALGALLAVGAVILWRRQAFWRRRSEMLGEEQKRLERMIEAGEADRTGKEKLSRVLQRAARPPQHQAELLEALAAETPRALTLVAVDCDGDRFAIRGRVEDAAGGPLDPFCRDLAAGRAPWKLDEPARSTPPSRGVAADFTVRGSFAKGAASSANDVAASESRDGLQARWREARARLPSGDAFDAWLRASAVRWSVELRSAEPGPEIGVRRYALAYRQPASDAWPDIVHTAQALCAEPSVTIDRLDLDGAPGETGSFLRAEIALTARVLEP